jgi:molecular chaperone GrpE
VQRPTPNEDAVRDQLREEAERAEQPAAGSPQPAEEKQEQPAEQDLPAAGGGLQSEAEDGATDEGAGDGSGPSSPEDALARAQQEAEQNLDMARRARADFENYRKRAAKDIAAAGARARAGLIREILPVVDNLERALDTAPEGDPMADGVRLVLVDMQGVLSRAGVETIEPKGEQFDPTVHEALTTRQEEGVDAGVVLDVVEKGYRSTDQVIRPARVIVAA